MAEMSVGEMCGVSDSRLFDLFLNITDVNVNSSSDGNFVTSSATASDFSSLAYTTSFENSSTSRDSDSNNASFHAFVSNRKALCSQHEFETIVSRLVPVVFAAIVVLGVVGNALVLVVVLCGKQMRNTTNVLILVSLRLIKCL